MLSRVGQTMTPGSRSSNLTDVHAIPELDRRGLREFGLVTGGMVAALFGLLLPWLFGFSFPKWPWLVFAVLFIWGIAAPDSLKPVHYWWMRFALRLSKITTPIVLGVVFYALFAPIGLIWRLAGKDPMRRSLDKSLHSYRVLPTKMDNNGLERPF